MVAGKRVIGVLVVGTDERGHRGRTDSIFVVFHNPSTRRTGVVVVPRDIRVGPGAEKINAVYGRQGIGGLKARVEDLLGQPIHYHAVLDLEGFVRLVDVLGPVTVYNDRPLRYVDRAGELYIDLPAGELELDGAKAAAYVRFRADERSDAGRSERQMELAQVLARRLAQERELRRDLRVLRTVMRFFRTDMPFHEVVWLLRRVGRWEASGFEVMRVPGVLREERGYSWIEVDRDSVRARVREFLLRLNTVPSEFTPSMVTVQVLNGTGIPGLASRARSRLLYFGYNVVEFGNAERDDHPRTLVLDRSGNLEAARRVREALKVGEVYPKIDRRLLVDVTVVVGRDFAEGRAER